MSHCEHDSPLITPQSGCAGALLLPPPFFSTASNLNDTQSGTMFTWLQSCEIKCWVSITQRAIDQILTRLLPSPFTFLDLKCYHFTHYPVAPWANNMKHHVSIFQLFHIYSDLSRQLLWLGALFYCSAQSFIYLCCCYKSNNKGSESAMHSLITGSIDMLPRWSWICKLVAGIVANYWAVLQFLGEMLVYHQ